MTTGGQEGNQAKPGNAIVTGRTTTGIIAKVWAMPLDDCSRILEQHPENTGGTFSPDC